MDTSCGVSSLILAVVLELTDIAVPGGVGGRNRRFRFGAEYGRRAAGDRFE